MKTTRLITYSAITYSALHRHQLLLVSIAHLGDANNNGIVDTQDHSLITNNWQKPATTWSNGDLNLDGITDIQDLTLVTNNWQQSSSFSLSASVPQSR